LQSKVLALASCPEEDEELFLPSNLSDSERTELGLSALADEEATLRQAQANECILQLRFNVKVITVLQKKRKRNVRGQRGNTRARSELQTVEDNRDRLLAIYNTSRATLIHLGVLLPTDSRLPPLTIDDLDRKDTSEKRQPGDTHRSEGRLWHIKGLSTVTPLRMYFTYLLRRYNHLPEKADASNPCAVTDGSPQQPQVMQVDADLNASSTSQTAHHIEVSSSRNPAMGVDDGPISSGRLWDSTVGLSEEDLQEWENEGYDVFRTDFFYSC
jgi:hypothetical protein